MPKARDPNRNRAFEIYKEHDGKIDLVEIASQLSISAGTIRGWKSKDKWDSRLIGTLRNNMERSNKNTERSNKKKPGGQPGNRNAAGHGAPKGNQNAVGHGAPKGNKNAEKYGFFSKYLPKETVSIIKDMPEDPLDVLWDQIQIAYAAIIRAQQIMYVRDQDDKTVEKVEDKCGNVVGERWEVQQAWDKQGNFLKAQARAQSELRSMIRQYDETLHKHWDLATDEQKARIEVLKARVKDNGQASAEDKVAKLFEAIGGALDAGAE